MDWSIAIGPLALPVQLLVLFAAIGLGLWVGSRAARRAGVSVERELNTALFIGLLVARLAFVLPYRAAYADAPWRVIDIRDGGWSPWAGLAAAWFYALVATHPRFRAQPAQRRPVVLALAVASVLWVAGSAAVLLKSPAVQGLPALQTLSMSGQRVNLAQPTGKPTVINLWATWCPPCQREMPVFERAQSQHPEVDFVLVNQGESPEQVARFLHAKGLQLDQVLLDPKAELNRQYGASGLPLTLFFDAQGKLISSRMGEVSAATLQQRLDGLR